MGFRPSPEELEVLIDEIDEDGSGAIEFGEFAQLCAKFLVEVRVSALHQRVWRVGTDLCKVEVRCRLTKYYNKKEFSFFYSHLPFNSIKVIR